MIDHVLGRPSVKSRRLQVLAVLGFWSAYLLRYVMMSTSPRPPPLTPRRGPRHGPPVLRFLSRVVSKQLTAWQTVVLTMIYLYIARNFSTLVGLASPDPLTNMYEANYFRATWVLTALDAGFWTAMGIGNKTLRDVASILFSVFYLVAAEQADEKVRKVRGNITVEHMRVSWNKGSQSTILRALQTFMRPRTTKWPAREIRIPRPESSAYKEPVSTWLYFDGPLKNLKEHTKIILDIPGGGFVAMDPRCNDDKLLSWAAKTGLPILSLDYKKAPEHPFPYALNECYDVYAALIKTRGQCIGMSGHAMPQIVITGDSAGGTLATATTLMIIERGSSAVRRASDKPDIPIPDGLILFYPALDMNIGSWMSDEQMALIQDRRVRSENKRIIQRKKSAYDSLVGTPAHSDDEDDTARPSQSPSADSGGETDETSTPPRRAIPPKRHSRSPAPEYAHSTPTTWREVPQTASSAAASAASTTTTTPATNHPQPMRTRLATSSMISYFNDRVLTPELMRAMIILYVGPHARPDFARDYLLSPILAPDMLLAKFPKTYFLTGERDPLVDDTVIFAGRLRRVKAAMHASRGTRLEYRDEDGRVEGWSETEVAEMVLLPGVSHGFVQFPSVYPPAWKLIERAAGWVEELFAAADERRSASAREGRRTRQRTESSGSEDRPLEMRGLTRGRGKSIANGNGAAAAGGESDGDVAAEGGSGDDGGAEGSGEEGNGSAVVEGRLRKVVRRGGKRDKERLGLASTDDLLGRRMHGLAGGLTSLPADPE